MSKTKNIRVYSRSFTVLILVLCTIAKAEDRFEEVETFNTACKLYREKELQSSERLFGEVAAQTDDDKLKHKAFYNRGTALLAGTSAGVITNRLEAIARAIDLFELSLELKPDDLDSKQNLERALNIMVGGRLTQAEKLIDEANGLLEQFQAKSAKENYETAKKTLAPILEDFAPTHPQVQPLVGRANQQLRMLEQAIEKTKEEMKNVKHAVDLYEYKAAADIMLADPKERRWAFDLDQELAQQFQQMIQNNQNVINIVYPPAQPPTPAP